MQNIYTNVLVTKKGLSFKNSFQKTHKIQLITGLEFNWI